MSAYHPTDDRFTFVTRVRQSPDVDTPFVAVGQAADNIEGVEFRTITKTFLPAVVRGRYSVRPPINGFTFFGPETAQRVAFGDSLAGARSSTTTSSAISLIQRSVSPPSVTMRPLQSVRKPSSLSQRTSGMCLSATLSWTPSKRS